jgi:cyanophycinase
VARRNGKPSGKLIVIGGHEDRDSESLILREVVRCADGGKVVVVTVASEEPKALWQEYRNAFAKLGVSGLAHLEVPSREELVRNPPDGILDDASCVFFTGGGQLRITSEFGGTELCDRLRDLYYKGVTVAGTSAGASVMCDTMLVDGAAEESHKIGDSLSMAPGLGFMPDVIIDQHFAERGRIGRLLGAVAHNPRLLGLGIDENTAIVVERLECFTVIGAGAVYVVDGREVTGTNVAKEETERTLTLFDLRLHVLSQGDEFDLRSRRPKSHPAEEVESTLTE